MVQMRKDKSGAGDAVLETGGEDRERVRIRTQLGD